MKHLLCVVVAFILCASTCQRSVTDVVESPKMIEYTDTLNGKQLDSIFIVDELSFNIEDDWIQSVALSGNKKDLLYKYSFIKEITDSTCMIYTLRTYLDSLYIINKIVVE